MGEKMTLPDAIKLSNENITVSSGLSSCELLAREVPKAPQTTKAIATAVCFMPEIQNKTTGHGETQLGFRVERLPLFSLSKTHTFLIHVSGLPSWHLRTLVKVDSLLNVETKKSMLIFHQ